MLSEGPMRPSAAFGDGAQRPCHWSRVRQQRQQHKLRQARVAGDMRETRRNYFGRGVAIDERRAQRCERMGPADEQRKPYPIAPRRPAKWQQAEELSLGGPGEDRLDVAAERRRGGKCEVRRVEHVRLDGAFGKPLPWIDDVGEARQRPPFDRDVLCGRQHVTPATGRPR